MSSPKKADESPKKEAPAASPAAAAPAPTPAPAAEPAKPVVTGPPPVPPMNTLGASITGSFDKHLEEVFAIGKQLHDSKGKLAKGKTQWKAPWYAFWNAPFACCMTCCGTFFWGEFI